MVYWKPRSILWFILGYLALSFYEPFWRLLIRGMFEGDSFIWSFMVISGSGVFGDYWILILLIIFGIILMFLGWRGARRLFQYLVLVWALLLVSISLSILVFVPEARYVGETMGIDIPYGLLIFPFDALFLFSILVYMVKYKKNDDPYELPKWNRVNTIFLVIAILILLLEYFAFNMTEQHGLYDQIGVFLTLIQWLFIMLGFYPWKPKTEPTLINGRGVS